MPLKTTPVVEEVGGVVVADIPLFTPGDLSTQTVTDVGAAVPLPLISAPSNQSCRPGILHGTVELYSALLREIAAESVAGTYSDIPHLLARYAWTLSMSAGDKRLLYCMSSA